MPRKLTVRTEERTRTAWSWQRDFDIPASNAKRQQAGLGSGLISVQDEREPDGGATFLVVGHPDFAAMRRDDVAGDG